MTRAAGRPTRSPPRCLRGMEGINRYWDGVATTWVAQVLPGDFYVSNSNEIITTVLGSCVAACMRDQSAGVGGINHFLLPHDPNGGSAGESSTRYGYYALERLINELLKNGARRESLEVKVFGGGRVIPGMGDVGRANIDFVRGYLEREGFVLTAEDVGRSFARRLRYHPLTGTAMVLHLPMEESTAVAATEREVALRIERGAARGNDVELFE